MQILYKTIVGSKLYGLDTPESDTDFKGFGMPSLSAIIGLNRQEQDESKSLSENTEGTIFSLNKYFHLLIKGNPTIFEIAFADPKFHIIKEPQADNVLDFVANECVTKHLFKPYNAYFRAQRHELNNTCRTGKRLQLVQQYGFDIKFAAHAARLGFQCCEIMQTGTLNPTMIGEEREVCFAIKCGKLTLSRVNDILEELDKKMYTTYKNSKLPEKPDWDKVNDFVIDEYFRHINTEYRN